MLKKIFIAVIVFTYMLTWCSECFCNDDLGMSTGALIKRLGYACSRVYAGFSKARISSGMHKVDNSGYVLEYNSRIMLLINEGDKKNIKNVAVTYIMGDDGHPQHYAKGGIPDNDTVFESVCKQVIFALDETITDSGADKILASIGLHGPVLDGFQRSHKTNGLNYIMKLQPNGMIMMVVSQIKMF